MSTLFLIGNGFDLNCGLKTRYTDMYNGYILSESKSVIIKSFKESISGDHQLWSDFELAIADYARNLNNELEIIECISDFSVYMREYLLNEQALFFETIKKNDTISLILNEMKLSLQSYYTGITHNLDSELGQRNPGSLENIKFATFNYTKVIDKVVELYTRNTKYARDKVLHIHGKVEEDPVLGLDNIEQFRIPYNLTEKGKRHLIKPVFNEIYDKNRVDELYSMIHNSDVIVAYGLSLGETDITWRNEIIQWLLKATFHHFIFYDYTLSSKEYRTINDRLDLEEDAKNELFAKWDISDENNSLINQIHIPCGKNIFNIQRAIEKV